MRPQDRPVTDHKRPAASLYFGKVMHARLKPVGHRFTYRVMSLLLDLDRLESADSQSCLFGVNRAAPYSFHEIDHGNRDGSSLRAFAGRCAADRDIDIEGGRVLLLCYPRLFGYAFNPLSIYFCYRADGELALVIYEVRNTLSEIHHYVIPVKLGEHRAAGLRQQHVKQFYVSPFIEMAACYHFRLSLPGDQFKMRILATGDQGPVLAATFSGRRRDLGSRALFAALFTLPLFTLKVIVAIYGEAMRLWLQGLPLATRGGA
jgi:uncharacterized protein